MRKEFNYEFGDQSMFVFDFEPFFDDGISSLSEIFLDEAEVFFTSFGAEQIFHINEDFSFLFHFVSFAHGFFFNFLLFGRSFFLLFGRSFFVLFGRSLFLLLFFLKSFLFFLFDFLLFLNSPLLLLLKFLLFLNSLLLLLLEFLLFLNSLLLLFLEFLFLLLLEFGLLRNDLLLLLLEFLLFLNSLLLLLLEFLFLLLLEFGLLRNDLFLLLFKFLGRFSLFLLEALFLFSLFSDSAHRISHLFEILTVVVFKSSLLEQFQDSSEVHVGTFFEDVRVVINGFVEKEG